MLHINVLEMTAAFFVIKEFAKHRQGLSILLLTDNVSVIAHINHMGGTRSPLLTALVKEMWLWCLQRSIRVVAQHLPGLENVTADLIFYPGISQTGQTGCWTQRYSNASTTTWAPYRWISLLLASQHKFLTFQLETRHRGRGNRCLSTGLVDQIGACTPAMVPHCQNIGQDPQGGGHSHYSDTPLAHSGMVPNLVGDAGGLPPATSNRKHSVSIPKLHGHNSVQPTSVGRLQGLRQRLRSKEISEQAIDLIIKSWRDKTNSNSNSAWKSWSQYCQSRHICPNFSWCFSCPRLFSC